jgi:hypothetical protein
LFLLSATSSPEWLLPVPAPQTPPFSTEEEDGVVRIRSGASIAGDLADLGVGVGSGEESKIKKKTTGERCRQVGAMDANDIFTLLANKIIQYFSVLSSNYFCVLSSTTNSSTVGLNWLDGS